MSGRLFIHIGLPKTATTTLQKDVFPALVGEKVCYLGVVQPRQGNQQEHLYSMCCEAVNSRNGLEETRRALRNRCGSGTTIVLSEEMFTVSSKGAAWREKLKNLAALLHGLDYVLIVTVREPAAALFSYYVELYGRFIHSKKSFLELAKTDECMEIFHYEKLSQTLLQHFAQDRIVVYKFEDIVQGRLEDLCRLITNGKQGWDGTRLGKHNTRVQSNGRVYTGKDFTLADLLRRTARALGILDAPLLHVLKMRLKPLVRAMDSVAFTKKAVARPTEVELCELRAFLKEETAALERYFGVKYH